MSGIPRSLFKGQGQTQGSLMRNKHNQSRKMEAESSFRKDFMEAMLPNFSIKVTDSGNEQLQHQVAKLS